MQNYYIANKNKITTIKIYLKISKKGLQNIKCWVIITFVRRNKTKYSSLAQPVEHSTVNR